MKKRDIILIIGAIFIWLFMITMVGTFISDNDSTQEDKSNQNVLGEGNIGKAHVKILESNIITPEHSDKTILLVKIAYTNNSDDVIAFDSILDCKAYQNGVELSTPISSYGIDGLDWKDKRKEVKSGVTFEFNYGFYIEDIESDVELEITPTFSTKYSKKVTDIIKLGE